MRSRGRSCTVDRVTGAGVKSWTDKAQLQHSSLLQLRPERQDVSRREGGGTALLSSSSKREEKLSSAQCPSSVSGPSLVCLLWFARRVLRDRYGGCGGRWHAGVSAAAVHVRQGVLSVDRPEGDEKEVEISRSSRLPLQDLYTLSTYAQWVPTRLSPELFQASVHPYLLPSIPLHSVVATSSARNGVECPRPAPVFSESASAGRNPKSSVAWNCRLGAAVPLAARGLSTRPHVPPLFPPTGATLTENSVTRLADLPLAPVHCLPHMCTSEARKARTRAWVLSQIEVQVGDGDGACCAAVRRVAVRDCSCSRNGPRSVHGCSPTYPSRRRRCSCRRRRR
ncbi:uncharacterized protein LOC123501451 [Portunus trituberculatus]|uniref:uncharacterized protein LOC123501451 n=1 Tax=Portunus trituberculatus TaxID=210409 RepID=UPI001E1CFF66|nr:uncharacterized protein LOC123501451 [Portunus trituberculatus]